MNSEADVFPDAKWRGDPVEKPDAPEDDLLGRLTRIVTAACTVIISILFVAQHG